MVVPLETQQFASISCAGRDVTGEAGVLIADINDQESLKNMCSMAKVVISCVGPVSGMY